MDTLFDPHQCTGDGMGVNMRKEEKYGQELEIDGLEGKPNLKRILYGLIDEGKIPNNMVLPPKISIEEIKKRIP